MVVLRYSHQIEVTTLRQKLFQEICKLLQIKRINSTAFSPKIYGKTEKFHAGLNQTMSHYVNEHVNDWDDFVDYTLMVHRSTPHTTTKYTTYYLLHGREMKLPTTICRPESTRTELILSPKIP